MAKYLRVHGLGNPKNKLREETSKYQYIVCQSYKKIIPLHLYWGRLGSNDDKCELNPTHDEEKVGPEGPPEKGS